MTLTTRLHDLSQALTAQIIDIIRDLTLEELLELTAEGTPKARRKKTAASKPKPKVRKKRAVSAPKQSASPVVEETKPEPPPPQKRRRQWTPCPGQDPLGVKVDSSRGD